MQDATGEAELEQAASSKARALERVADARHRGGRSAWADRMERFSGTRDRAPGFKGSRASGGDRGAGRVRRDLAGAARDRSIMRYRDGPGSSSTYRAQDDPSGAASNPLSSGSRRGSAGAAGVGWSNELSHGAYGDGRKTALRANASERGNTQSAGRERRGKRSGAARGARFDAEDSWRSALSGSGGAAYEALGDSWSEGDATWAQPHDRSSGGRWQDRDALWASEAAGDMPDGFASSWREPAPSDMARDSRDGRRAPVPEQTDAGEWPLEDHFDWFAAADDEFGAGLADVGGGRAAGSSEDAHPDSFSYRDDPDPVDRNYSLGAGWNDGGAGVAGLWSDEADDLGMVARDPPLDAGRTNSSGASGSAGMWADDAGTWAAGGSKAESRPPFDAGWGDGQFDTPEPWAGAADAPIFGRDDVPFSESWQNGEAGPWAEEAGAGGSSIGGDADYAANSSSSTAARDNGRADGWAGTQAQDPASAWGRGRPVRDQAPAPPLGPADDKWENPWITKDVAGPEWWGGDRGIANDDEGLLGVEPRPEERDTVGGRLGGRHANDGEGLLGDEPWFDARDNIGGRLGGRHADDDSGRHGVDRADSDSPCDADFPPDDPYQTLSETWGFGRAQASAQPGVQTTPPRASAAAAATLLAQLRSHPSFSNANRWLDTDNVLQSSRFTVWLPARRRASARVQRGSDSEGNSEQGRCSSKRTRGPIGLDLVAFSAPRGRPRARREQLSAV